MSFDEALAARCRRLLARKQGVTERKMFGGLSFLLAGNMFCGVVGNRLVVRLGVSGEYERALRATHVKPMDFTGRPLRGFVYVDAPGLAGNGLRTWVRQALAFGSTLPRKVPLRAKARPARKPIAAGDRRDRSRRAATARP